MIVQNWQETHLIARGGGVSMPATAESPMLTIAASRGRFRHKGFNPHPQQGKCGLAGGGFLDVLERQLQQAAQLRFAWLEPAESR